jgi:acyl-CoA thioesterase-1
MGSHQHYLLAGLCAWLALACGAPPPETPLVAEGSAPGAASQESEANRPVVLFVGTSLTAGYGLPSEQAFPALLQRRVDEASLGYRVVNAGVSGDTSAGGLRRMEWLLEMPVAVLVLELGANDMLRGLQVEAMRDNLRAILDLSRDAYPDAHLAIAGMRAAPNLGARYGTEFEAVFPEIALQYQATLIPFLLEGVAADPRLNQPDGIHPTAEGHEIVAINVWQVLEPLLDAAGAR